MSVTDLTHDDVLKVLRLIDRSQFDHFELKSGDLKLAVSRGGQETRGTASPKADGVAVRAPRLGIFRSLKEDAAAAPAAGTMVSGKTLLGHIEVMHDTYPVLAGTDGHIQEAAVQDGAFVEYGQTLFVLSPGKRQERA